MSELERLRKENEILRRNQAHAERAMEFVLHALDDEEKSRNDMRLSLVIAISILQETTPA